MRSGSSGCVSTLEVAGGTSASPFTLELVGEKGWLKLVGGGGGGYQTGWLKLETSVPAGPQPEPAVPGLQGPPANLAECYTRFADDIHAGTRTVPDFDDAVRLTLLLDRIGAASETGQRQRL